MLRLLSIVMFGVVSLYAHFGVLLPNTNIIQEDKDATIKLTYSFMHPFEQSYMKLEKPAQAGVFVNGETINITKTLTKSGESWEANFEVKAPSVYQFFMDPVLYFEPAEGLFIRHLTKTIIDAYGSGEGWDTPIGLKAEIIPLTRPYGLYKGNIFSAKVLYKGDIIADTEVEIEFYNQNKLKAPTEDHITQTVKTDSNGVFHFVMPKAGWWGFSALIEDDLSVKKDGKEYPIELGAVLWIKTDDYK